jgi:hypothetical protein
VELVRQFHHLLKIQSLGIQDKHTISTVFIAKAKGEPKGMDDAMEARYSGLMKYLKIMGL